MVVFPLSGIMVKVDASSSCWTSEAPNEGDFAFIARSEKESEQIGERMVIHDFLADTMIMSFQYEAPPKQVKTRR